MNDSPDLPGRTYPSGRQRWRRLRQDLGYLLTALPLSVLGFAVLLPMTVLGVSTLIIWVGALVLPVTLILASRLAQQMRAMVRRWGLEVPEPGYQPTEFPWRGAVRVLTDPRRWLDLAFMLFVAFPLRLVTFVLAISWLAGAVAGFVYPLWGWAVPGSSWPIEVAKALDLSLPEGQVSRYLLECAAQLLVSLVLLLTGPAVIRAITSADVWVTRAMLGGDGPADGPSRSGAAEGLGGLIRPHLSTIAWAELLAVVLLAVGWPIMAALYQVHPAVAMVIALAQSAAIVLAVRSAPVGLGLAIAGFAGGMAATAPAALTAPWPWPVPAMLALCAVLAILALGHAWPWSLAGWAATGLMTAVALGFDEATGAANGIVAVAVSGGAALLGALGRLWALSVSRVEEAETAGAQESRRRMELQERTRIARELHDVVAHSMSVINVQATTAKYRRPGLDEWVQREFDDIATSSRQALGEMRALLGILRGDDEALTAPLPGIADIPAMVEASRASGTTITFSGADADTSATVGVTGYRVVQEALSNAIRHAPGLPVQVRVATHGSSLLIEVVNDLPEQPVETATGSGLGLAGIEERVAALGGATRAGPDGQGRFVVAVSVPLTAG